MVQVRPWFCACAFRADLVYLQLAVSGQLISSRHVCRSLCHPFCVLSHRLRRPRHHSGVSNRPRRLSTPSARLYGLLARFIDFVHSFRRCARFGHCWDLLSNRIRRCQQPLRGPDRPRRLSTPLAPPSPILGLYPDMVRPFCRRACF